MHGAGAGQAGLRHRHRCSAEKRQAEAAQAAINGYADMLEQLPVAMAIFDEDRRLSRYNSGYAKLWSFSTAWLDTNPTIDQILNELRDNRRLPEQRDFVEWKKSQVKAFSSLGQKTEQVWHMPQAQERSHRYLSAPAGAGFSSLARISAITSGWSRD